MVAGVLGNSVLLPKLKQLPERALQLETVRQKLLAQVRKFASLSHWVYKDWRVGKTRASTSAGR